MTLGEKLSRLRGSRSYAAVAVKAGCSGEHLRRLEQGQTKPSISLAFRLAREYGVSLDWLADDSRDWPPPQSESDQMMGLIKHSLAKGGILGKLTPDDCEVIAIYRRLDEEGKAYIKGCLTGLSAGADEE